MIETSSLDKEGVYRVSKMMKLPVLLEEEEMQTLFDELDCFVTHPHFLDHYGEYLTALRMGERDLSRFRQLLCPMLTSDEKALWKLVVGDKELIKPRLPVIQVQAFFFRYDGQLREQVFGTDVISWGVQFSYPHLFQHPKTHDVIKWNEFDNTPLFQQLQRWIRKHTSPTPYMYEGERVNLPIRVGKECTTFAQAYLSTR